MSHSATWGQRAGFGPVGLKRTRRPSRIADALSNLLGSPDYRLASERLADVMAREDAGRGRALDELEQLGLSSR